MVIAEQIRAARAALGWSADELAKVSKIARRTLVSIETGEGVPSAKAQTLAKVEASLRAAGIEFIGTPEDGPGIRIRFNPDG